MKSEFRADVSAELQAKLLSRPRKERIWNGWSNNYLTSEGGYITHVWEEGVTPIGRSICGVEIAEGGGLTLSETEPGCIRCRKILRSAGLIEQS